RYIHMSIEDAIEFNGGRGREGVERAQVEVFKRKRYILVVFIRNDALQTGRLAPAGYFNAAYTHFSVAYISCCVVIKLPGLVIEYQYGRQHANTRGCTPFEIHHAIQVQLVAGRDIRQL